MNRNRIVVGSFALGCALLAASTARADSVAGVCPDGSVFVVANAKDVPCARAKLVEPSDLPPIKPQYLPRPYLWYVDQQVQDENNPYNLVDKAQRLRQLRAGEVEAATPRAAGDEVAADGALAPPRGGTSERAEPSVGEATPRPPAGSTAGEVAVSLSEDELADLVQVILLRQQLAPASIEVRDASGRPEVELRYAYSTAFERRVSDALPAAVAASGPRVLVFSAKSTRETEFYPRFLVTQAGGTFRPQPDDATQQGLLLGEAGPMAPGTLVVGYVVLPPRFDPTQPLDLWWNDRRVTATLASDATQP